MPCLVNGYLNYKGNSTSIFWREMTWKYRQYVPLKHWYRHTRWHGVVTQRITVLTFTVLTSTAMKTPQSYVLHIYMNEFYICLEWGFSRLLCWCITKQNLKISMYIFFFGTNALRTKWAIRHWNLWQTSSKLWVNFIGNKKSEIWELKCFHSWGDTSPLCSD